MDMMIQNLWDAANTVLRRKFIAIQSYLEESEINNLTVHLKQLEKKEQTKPKVSRRKEIIKIREEINAIQMKKTMEKINETKSWFFEKINKIDKLLGRLIKKKRERAQINNVRNEKGEVTKDTTKIQRIIRDYHKQLYPKKKKKKILQSGLFADMPRFMKEDSEIKHILGVEKLLEIDKCIQC